MRKSLFVLAVFLAAGIGGNAFASYNCSSAPYFVNFWPGYYEYTHNPLVDSSQDCWTFDSGVSFVSQNGCSWSQGGWEILGFNQNISQSFTVGANDGGSSTWELDVTPDVISPGGYYYDQLTVTVVVTHNGVNTPYTIYYHNGTQGSVSCANTTYGLFYAVNGDTVTIAINGSRADPSSHVRVSDVRVRRLP